MEIVKKSSTFADSNIAKEVDKFKDNVDVDASMIKDMKKIFKSCRVEGSIEIEAEFLAYADFFDYILEHGSRLEKDYVYSGLDMDFKSLDELLKSPRQSLRR